MRALYEDSASLAKTFVLIWAEDARANEEKWDLMEQILALRTDLLVGLRGGTSPSLGITKKME